MRVTLDSARRSVQVSDPGGPEGGAARRNAGSAEWEEKGHLRPIPFPMRMCTTLRRGGEAPATRSRRHYRERCSCIVWTCTRATWRRAALCMYWRQGVHPTAGTALALAQARFTRGPDEPVITVMRWRLRDLLVCVGSAGKAYSPGDGVREFARASNPEKAISEVRLSHTACIERGLESGVAASAFRRLLPSLLLLFAAVMRATNANVGHAGPLRLPRGVLRGGIGFPHPHNRILPLCCQYIQDRYQRPVGN